MNGACYVKLAGNCLSLLMLASVIAGQTHDGEERNSAGWQVPNVARLQVKKEVAESHPGRQVTRSDFVLGRYKPNTQIDDKTFCEFFSLSSYESDGKIFAISGSCVFFGVSKSRSRTTTVTSKSYAGAITDFTFYDKDGDGKFESRYNSAYPRQ